MALPREYYRLSESWPGRPNEPLEDLRRQAPSLVTGLIARSGATDYRDWPIWESLRSRLPAAVGDWLPQPNLAGGQRRKAIWVLGEFGPMASNAVPRLRQIEQTAREAELKVAATVALAKILPGDREALNRLLAALTNAQQTPRFYAALEFGAVRPTAPEALAVLISALRDTDGEVRANAAWSVGQFGPRARAAVPILRQLLTDPHRHVPACAAYALVRVAPEHAEEARQAMMVHVLRRTDLVGFIAPDFFRELRPGEAGQAAVPFLEENLAGRNTGLEPQDAAIALLRVRGQASPAVVRELAELRPPSLPALEALATIGPPAAAAVPRLNELAKGPSPTIAAAATAALQRITNAVPIN